MLDKQDLLAYSTEFSLAPVHAHEVESVGRILGPKGNLLAAKTLRAILSGPRVLRLTTQREFACRDLGDPDRAGDEQGVRIPGVAADRPFLPRNQGPGVKTWGQGLPGLGGAGTGVQLYPEPYAAPAGALPALSPADYDGSLMQATVETTAGDTYTADAAPNTMTMLARYTTHLDLDVSAAAPTRPPGDDRWRNRADTKQAPLANGLFDAALPNTLHPDGAYSEWERAPAYLDEDNLNGLHGLISFWAKSNYHMGEYLGPEYGPGNPYPPGSYNHWPLDRSRQYLKWSNYDAGPFGGQPSHASVDQFFALVHTENIGADNSRFICQFETGHQGSDSMLEHRFQTGDRPWGQRRVSLTHQWQLITFAWDLHAPGSSYHQVGELLTNGGLEAEDRAPDDDYPYSGGNDPSLALSFTADDRFGKHLIMLGRRGFLGEADIIFTFPEIDFSVGLGADATFDEFAAYDFGGFVPEGRSAESLNAPADLALTRFREGRYYKESDYTDLVDSNSANKKAGRWFSPRIDLGASRILSLSWTQVVPRGLKAPLDADGRAGIDGDPGPDGRVSLELSDLVGNGYAPDARGVLIDARFTDDVLSRINRPVSSPFRLHAVFQPNLADKDNTPILDPLALDDITILYEPVGGRTILRWEEGGR
jgi:hypothetical protein